MGDIKDTVKNQVQEKGWGTAQRGDAGLQLILSGFYHFSADDPGELCRRMCLGPRKSNSIRVVLVQRLLRDMCTSHDKICVGQ